MSERELSANHEARKFGIAFEDASMNGGVSVIICCHNSAERLPETLRHLAAQQVPEGLPWEIVVVDNASTDDTAQTAARCWPTSARAVLRVVFEPQAGLSHARIKGIREARYEIASFIDDDNWTSPDWIKRVNALFASRPEIGACGGRIEAVCEITPPDWFESLKKYYAVGRQHSQSGDITNTPGTLLCGAGLNLRAVAMRKLLEDGFVFMMTGRSGTRVLTGEDTELCFALRASGWRLWYDADLLLRHFIPKARLRWDYVRRLMRGMGESSTLFVLYLSALKGPPFDTYPPWKMTWLFQILKAFRQFVWVLLSHPEACLRQPEGSLPALEFEKSKSRLAALWSLRGRYNKLREDIRQSAWANGPPKSAR
jgi:glycosyltransferase involved in cell wall biosynthesis